MGMPEIKIAFIEITKKAIENAGRGIVLLLVKDNKNKGITEILKKDEIPDKFTGDTLEIIKQTFEGNLQDKREGNHLVKTRYAPSKVIVYGIPTSEELDTTLKKLETTFFNFIAYPEMEGEQSQKLIDFIKKLKKGGQESTAIISSKTINADSEDVINFVEDDFKVKGKSMTAQKYTGRIAGLIAGTPYTQSITFSELDDVTEIADKEKSLEDASINQGKLILCRKRDKIRIASGVNTRTTVDEARGEQFKKIKLVNIFKFINNSIYKVIVEQYIGKVGNTYDNKCLLIADIRKFLSDIQKEGLIENDFSVGIHMQKQREYLKSIGVDIENMKEQEIKEANTRNKVFLLITLKGVDAMEDFDIEIMV